MNYVVFWLSVLIAQELRPMTKHQTTAFCLEFIKDKNLKFFTIPFQK